MSGKSLLVSIIGEKNWQRGFSSPQARWGHLKQASSHTAPLSCSEGGNRRCGEVFFSVHVCSCLDWEDCMFGFACSCACMWSCPCCVPQSVSTLHIDVGPLDFEPADPTQLSQASCSRGQAPPVQDLHGWRILSPCPHTCTAALVSFLVWQKHFRGKRVPCSQFQVITGEKSGTWSSQLNYIPVKSWK